MTKREEYITILKHLREIIDAKFHNGGLNWHTHLFERNDYDIFFLPPMLDIVVKKDGSPTEAHARIEIENNIVRWSEFRVLPEGCKDPMAAEVIFTTKKFNISNPTCFEDFKTFVETHEIVMHESKWMDD